MRGNTGLVAVGLVSALLIGGCGTVVAGGSNGSGEPPVLHVGLDGSRGMDAAKISSGVGPGAGRYRVDGVLPKGPGRAPTYLVPAAHAAAVRQLAAALGLHAAARRHAHGWVVTAAGTVLRVRDNGQWSWQRLSDTCPPSVVDVDSADGAGGVACAVAASSDALAKSAGGNAPDAGGVALLSPQELRKRALPLLRALGLDPSAAVAFPYSGTVSVQPVVAGLPTTGYGTDVVVRPAGVWAATGWLYPRKATGGNTYPLITARAALDRFSSGPQPMMGAPEIACPLTAKSSPAQPPVCGGGTVVTGGRLGLQLRWDGGYYQGRPLLVPAWFLDVRGSDQPLVLDAVSPKYLADPVMPTNLPTDLPSTLPNPAGPPSDLPGSSGGGSTGGSTGSGSGSGSGGTTSVPGTLPLSSYKASDDGRSLKLTGWGSPCERYGPGPVDETAGTVTVGIVLTLAQPTGTACVDMAQQVDVQVTLKTPLGSRTVIDASTGAKVPTG